MPVRPIVLYPDPILKQVCSPIEDIGPEVEAVLQDLEDTLGASPGVGVAAPQIGVALRAIAVDVTPKNPGHGLLLLINPELVSLEGARVVREGCLSIPEYTANVRRAEKVVVQGRDRTGAMVVFESTGLEAICLQHEIDHLDGILFLDRVASLSTDVFRRKGVPARFQAADHHKRPIGERA
ncbi:MAG: peptide deformylase [Armatimonadetes bacterium]|nr:peptide deformylase [Armatimonadota bacterium]